MLARSYKTMGRYEEAAEAYGKAEKVINDDPDLLASYAETLAMATGKGLQGKPTKLVERALKLEPMHGHSLFLAVPPRWMQATRRRPSPIGKPCCRRSKPARKSTRCCVAASTG